MCMKKILLALCLISVLTATAQEGETLTPKGFDRNRVFIGSGLNLGLSNRSFNIGLNPEIGYSLNNWLDVGIATNFSYFTQSADLNGIRYRDLNYGLGAFVRAWPLNFLFVQVQPENNWINSAQYIPSTNQNFTYKLNASSLLAGIGYGSRQVGARISYFIILIDVAAQRNSPYVDSYGSQQPVFRAGFGFYLKPKR